MIMYMHSKYKISPCSQYEHKMRGFSEKYPQHHTIIHDGMLLLPSVSRIWHI